MEKMNICSFFKKLFSKSTKREQKKKCNLSTSIRTWETAEDLIFNKVNGFRKDYPLEKSDILYDIAKVIIKKYAQDDISLKTINKHSYFPITIKMLIDLGLKGGENLGSHFHSVEGVVKAWGNSKPHLENIKGNWTHTGVAVEEGKSGAKYYIQIFAR